MRGVTKRVWPESQLLDEFSSGRFPTGTVSVGADTLEKVSN